MRTLRVLISVLLHAHFVHPTSVVSRRVLIVFLRPDRIKLSAVRVSVGAIVEILVALEWALALRPTTHEVLLQNIPVGLGHLLDVEFVGVLSLLIGDLLAINFRELWQHLDDERAVILVSRARVVTQPEHTQILQLLEVLNLL